MKPKLIFFFTLFSCCLLLPISAFSKDRVKVLLLSGSNNHNWKETTPKLKSILEKSGLFEVTVTEDTKAISVDLLKRYQLILSNWNLFPERNCIWSEETKNAVLEFVREGGGFVFIHAASSVNYDWKEYQELAGATWGKQTRHGKKMPFEVKITGTDHPVTKGISNFWTTDELWVEMDDFKTSNVLAQAFSPLNNKGREEMEPLVFEREYGKGRSFFLVLGHDVETMKNLGFQTLLLRGAEWAATGKVTQQIPRELAQMCSVSTKNYRWQKSKNSLALSNSKHVICKFNFDQSEGKPYFHPLCTTDGTELTWLRPEDHPWHRAVWFSWKYINGLNYWEEDHNTGISEGITELKSVDYSTSPDFEADIQIELSYHPPGEADLLNEMRTIHVSKPDKSGSYYLDWESTFTAAADEIVLDRTPLPDEPDGRTFGGYACFSARLNKNLWDVKPINCDGKTGNLHGQTSKWMTFEMKNLQGEPVSITIFDHPQNLGFPNKWYITTTTNIPFYYFSPAPLFSSKISMKKGETMKLKYRLLITPDKVTEQELKTNWTNFKTK